MESTDWHVLQLTITAGLNRHLNVADRLHGGAVLVVTVDKLVLELTDLVDENTELVGNVGDVIVATLTPLGELLLCHVSVIGSTQAKTRRGQG